MDVVANNVANINTTGFKADRSLVRGISDVERARGQFRRAATAASRSCRTAPPSTISRAGSIRADQEPARRRDRRPRLPGGADARRRALHPRRRPADQQSGPARHRRPAIPCSAPPARSCSSRPTRTSASPPTATSPCSKAPTASTRSAASCAWSRFADAQQLVKEGSNLYSAGEGNAAQPDTTSRVRQGFVEKSNVNSVHRDEPHDRDHAHLHADLGAAAAAGRPAQIRDRKARRRSGITEGH